MRGEKSSNLRAIYQGANVYNLTHPSGVGCVETTTDNHYNRNVSYIVRCDNVTREVFTREVFTRYAFTQHSITEWGRVMQVVAVLRIVTDVCLMCAHKRV